MSQKHGTTILLASVCIIQSCTESKMFTLSGERNRHCQMLSKWCDWSKM